VPETPTITEELEEAPVVTVPAPPVEVATAPGTAKRWKVQVRMGVVEIEVEAPNLYTAAHEAMTQYPAGEVISVVES